jgi:AcrR family transcriptional regulator
VPEKPRSIWLRKERSGRGPVPEHGRDQIAAAAIELADASGLDAVSTRKVAAAIGAGATSLYRYVENRDELLELMLDAAIGQLELTRPVTGNWRADLTGLAHDLRSLYRRHPWMLDLAQGQTPLTPNSVEFLEYALSTLTRVQVPGQLKMEAIGLLNGVVVLLTRLEVSAGRSPQAWQAAQVDYLAAVVANGGHPHLADAFRSSTESSGSQELLDSVLLRVLSGVLDPD